MLSLRQPIITNVLLLFHPVCDQVSLAFPTPRKVEGADRAAVWQRLQDVGAFEAVGAVSVQEEDACVGSRCFLSEDGSVEFLVVVVGDSMNFMCYICKVEYVFLDSKRDTEIELGVVRSFVFEELVNYLVDEVIVIHDVHACLYRLKIFYHYPYSSHRINSKFTIHLSVD
jgi:hypothetical protein